MPNSKKEHTYFVKGMHCASCEILIEKRLLALKEIKSVESSADKGRVFIVYEGERPRADRLNKIFRKENYNPYLKKYVDMKWFALFKEDWKKISPKLKKELKEKIKRLEK